MGKGRSQLCVFQVLILLLNYACRLEPKNSYPFQVKIMLVHNLFGARLVLKYEFGLSVTSRVPEKLCI
jgi:hypothetical protein